MQFLSILIVIVFILLPIPVIWSLRKISESNSRQDKHEELEELENALSHLLADLEKSTNESLGKVERAIEEMDKMVELTNERTKELEALMATMSVASEPHLISPAVQSGLQSAESGPEPTSTIGISSGMAGHEEGDPSKKVKILALARRGWSIQEIAKETGAGTGEVQLILNLKDH